MNHKAASLDTPQASMDAIKAEIATTFAQIDALKAEMAAWYAAGHTQRFPHYPRLAALEVTLSQLDSMFKQLWDAQHGQRRSAAPQGLGER